MDICYLDILYKMKIYYSLFTKNKRGQLVETLTIMIKFGIVLQTILEMKSTIFQLYEYIKRSEVLLVSSNSLK